MAQLRDTVVSGSLRATDTLYATTAQFNILKVPTTSGGTDFGIGTAGSVLKTGANGVYWSALSTSDLTSGTLGIGRGGTGTTTSPTQGGIIYASSTSAYASTAAGTSGQYLKSNGTGAPTWASFSASTVGLGNVTNAAQITKATFTKAYQLMYSTAASAPAVLDANTTTTKKFLTMTGTGSAGAAPSWGTLAAADIPDISGTYLKLTGGTISGNLITQKFIRPVVTGSGTAAVTSSPYKPALWKFNLATATPTEGDIITITIPVAGHGNGVFVSTDNGTTYKPVSVSGTTRLTTHYPVGTTISLVYDADGATNTVYPVAGATATTNITGGCWRVLNYYDSGNDTSSIYSFGGSSRQAETSANGGIGLWRYSLQLMTANRKWSSIAYNTSATTTDSGTTTNKSVSTASFLLDAPILYQDTNTKVDAGSSGNVNGRTAVSFDMRYNTTNAKWSNLTIQMPVFLVGTVNNDGATFKLDTTQWWTQTLPSSNDGKIYILLGYANSTTAVYLLTYHPIYYHNGTNVVPYVVKVLDVAHGGTGATTAANARTNLGLGSAATLDVWGDGGSTYSATKVLIPRINTDGVMEVGKYIDFHSDTTASDYNIRITANTSLDHLTNSELKIGTPTHGDKIRFAIENGEGGQIDITGPNSTTICMDAYLDSTFRIYTYGGSSGTYRSIEWIHHTTGETYFNVDAIGAKLNNKTDNQYTHIDFVKSDGIARNIIYVDTTVSGMFFRSVKAGQNNTAWYEDYWLPHCTASASGGVSYEIITTKNVTNNTTAGSNPTANTNVITANTLINYKGTTNINTVGTITSGTWNAGAITTSGSLTLKSTATTSDVRGRHIYGGAINQSVSSTTNYEYTTFPGTWNDIILQNRYRRVTKSNNNIDWYSSRMYFKQFSATANSGTRLEYAENYYLPSTTDGLTEDVGYNILTSKSAVTIAQGGTGARNVADAILNLFGRNREARHDAFVNMGFYYQLVTGTLSANGNLNTGISSSSWTILAVYDWTGESPSIILSPYIKHDSVKWYIRGTLATTGEAAANRDVELYILLLPMDIFEAHART